MQFIRDLIATFVATFVNFFVSLLAAIVLILAGSALAAFGLVTGMTWLMYLGAFIAIAAVLWTSLLFITGSTHDPGDQP